MRPIQRLPRVPLALLLLLLSLGVLPVAGMAPSVANAEDELPKEGETEKGESKEEAAADTNPLEAAEDKAAKVLATELKKIAKKKNSEVVLPVLEKIDAIQHKAFDKPLLRMLKHPSSLVALRTADMWEWRVRDKKVASKLWSAAWGDKKNERRYAVKAKVLKAFPRGGIVLNDKQFKEIERAWRWIVGNPNPALGPALAAMAEYADLAKDKRLFRKLAEELDEPGTNVNASDPNNPPQEWWERRWKLWKEAKPAVVAALKSLTGKEFDKTAAAKAWCEKQSRKAGFDW